MGKVLEERWTNSHPIALKKYKAIARKGIDISKISLQTRKGIIFPSYNSFDALNKEVLEIVDIDPKEGAINGSDGYVGRKEEELISIGP